MALKPCVSWHILTLIQEMYSWSKLWESVSGPLIKPMDYFIGAPVSWVQPEAELGLASFHVSPYCGLAVGLWFSLGEDSPCPTRYWMNSWNVCSRHAPFQKVLGRNSQVKKHLDSITQPCAGNRLADAYPVLYALGHACLTDNSEQLRKVSLFPFCRWGNRGSRRSMGLLRSQPWCTGEPGPRRPNLLNPGVVSLACSAASPVGGKGGPGVSVWG